MPVANETQKTYFYGPNWSEELDETLIDVLKEQCCSDFGCVPINNSKFLDMIVDNAADTVNYILDTKFTSDEILMRFENLAARHQCLRMILELAEVMWDFPKNHVVASDSVWENFISENAMAVAYKENGEFAWCDFEMLFGIVPVRAQVYKPRPPRTNKEVIAASRKKKGAKCNLRNGCTVVSDRLSDTNRANRLVNDFGPQNGKANDSSGGGAATSSQASCSAKSCEF